MPCIDLIYCTKQNLISKYGVDASIFDKCHHNIIYGQISIYPSHQNMSVKYEITVKQMFKILKNLLKTLIGEKLLNLFL